MIVKKQDKTTIVQIWGEILDEGFTSVPNILLRYRSKLGLKSHHLALVIDIMSFKWDEDNPFPSYSTLAQRANITERGIRKIIHELERLNLLIRTPRFDETGAQITTIFDFRPLVQKLTEEMKKAEMKHRSSNISKARRRGEELQFQGEEELQFRGRVTNSSGGGRNQSSSKEYSYTNNTQLYTSTLDIKNANVSKEDAKDEVEDTEQENSKERVHKYFRNGIFRKRLFEIYDNLHTLKSIEELVEEGSYKACKEIMVNRVAHLSKNNLQISLDQIAEQVRSEFPYSKVPKNYDKARSFFVANVCDLTTKKILLLLEE
jgi:hypothetical protein